MESDLNRDGAAPVKMGAVEGEEEGAWSGDRAGEDAPPTRAEFEELAAEVRRLAERVANGRG